MAQLSGCALLSLSLFLIRHRCNETYTKSLRDSIGETWRNEQRSGICWRGGSDELDGAKAAGFTLVVFMEGFVASNGLRKPSEIQGFRSVADLSIQKLDALASLLDVVKID